MVKIKKELSLTRSATAPETIVAAVAANIAWNSQSVNNVKCPLYAAVKLAGFAQSPMPKPAKPRIPLKVPGYIRPKPNAAYIVMPMAGTAMFLKATLAEHFARTRPASTHAKPRPMMNTNMALIIIQMFSVIKIASLTVATFATSFI